MYNSEDEHFETRLSTVRKIIYEWEHSTNSIVYLWMVNSTEVYKNLLSWGEEYGRSVESTFISCLFSICSECIKKVVPVLMILDAYILRILSYVLYYVYIAYFAKIENLLKRFLNNFILLAWILLYFACIYFTTKFWRIPSSVNGRFQFWRYWWLLPIRMTPNE